MNTKRFVSLAFMILALWPATVVTAANKYWKNSVGTGNWSGGNNWSNVSAGGADNGGVPAANDTPHIIPTDGAARTNLADSDMLYMEIGGTTPGSDYDRLSVAGSATLDGTLDVSLINGFMPTAGQPFTILAAGSIVNNGLALATADASLFNLIVGSTSVMLEAIGLPGDFNHDGTVDAADYVVWRKTDGTQTGYNAWRTHFAQTVGGGAGASGNSAAPEPSTFILLLGILAMSFVHRPTAS
jgi:hypothetical protein